MAQSKTELSKKRMIELEKAIFKAINATAKRVTGDFSISEVNDVMIRIAHNYNKIGLEQQRKDYGEAPMEVVRKTDT